jgi:hypothetical protein
MSRASVTRLKPLGKTFRREIFYICGSRCAIFVVLNTRPTFKLASICTFMKRVNLLVNWPSLIVYPIVYAYRLQRADVRSH